MRRLTLVVTWVLVTAGAMGMAWTIVSRISTGATEGKPRVLSGEAVEAALRQPVESTTTTEAASPAPGSATTTVTTAAPASAPTAHPATTVAPAKTSATTRPPAPTTTTEPANQTPTTAPPSLSPTTTVPSSSPTSTTTTTAAPNSLVVTSTGGVATVSCSGNQIRLVSSNPRNGFSQSVGDSGPSQVEITYRAQSHKSEIKAQCTNGRPVASVDETNGNGGDH